MNFNGKLKLKFHTNLEFIVYKNNLRRSLKLFKKRISFENELCENLVCKLFSERAKKETHSEISVI